MSQTVSRLERTLGVQIKTQRPLSGGCVAKLSLVQTADGRRLVVKEGGRQLALEGWMLTFLKGKLPVPEVLLAEDDLLVMTFIAAGAGGLDDRAQEHCAELTAALHGHSAPAFGLDRDTLIGGLAQPRVKTH